MVKFVAFVSFCLVGMCFAMPASNEQLDKATVNDVAINAVSEEKRTDQSQVQSQQQIPSTVEITGISTGANPAPANPAIPENSGGFKPQRTGSMFARLIDDIFQIPITVLQNVARLITNPFTQARKEAATSLTDPVK